MSLSARTALRIFPPGLGAVDSPKSPQHQSNACHKVSSWETGRDVRLAWKPGVGGLHRLEMGAQPGWGPWWRWRSRQGRRGSSQHREEPSAEHGGPQLSAAQPPSRLMASHDPRSCATASPRDRGGSRGLRGETWQGHRVAMGVCPGLPAPPTLRLRSHCHCDRVKRGPSPGVRPQGPAHTVGPQEGAAVGGVTRVCGEVWVGVPPAEGRTW